MRIAVNTRLLIAGKMDGIGWFTCETLRQMVTSHPEHDFFFFFDRRVSEEFCFGENVHPVVLFPPARHPVLWYIYFQWTTRWALIHYQIDLYLSTDGFIPLHSKVPTIDVIHDLNFEHTKDNLRPSHQRYMSHFFPLYAKRANWIATVSQYSRTDISKTYNIPLEKIGVVYNGSHSNYTPIEKKEQEEVRKQYTQGDPYFIFVSTIHKRKNLTGLLKAFDIFKQDDEKHTRLIIVGARQYWKGELEQTYESMQHRQEVVFLGHVEPKELARLMGTAIALVYPSFFEGFGIPILEAFYAETSVITSNVTSMPEVAGDAAILVDPTNIEAIADGMRQLAQSPELRKELIEKGKARRQLFSWQRTADLLWEEMMKTTKKQ